MCPPHTIINTTTVLVCYAFVLFCANSVYVVVLHVFTVHTYAECLFLSWGELEVCPHSLSTVVQRE
jgi:hypothetical protein